MGVTEGGRGWLATSPLVQNYLSQGVVQSLGRNALMLPGREGLGALVPAYLLSQKSK